MNIIMMAVMLFLTFGIAGFFYTSKWNRDKCFSSGGCLMLTVVLVIGVMALFGFVGRLFPAMSIGVALLQLLGICGHFRLLYRSFGIQNGRLTLTARGKEVLSGFYSPALICAAITFMVTLILSRGLLVYRYDDLKQWGAAAKFMVDNEALPRENEFFGSLNHYLTSTFFTSYFGIGSKWVTGKLVEHDLYAANMLFITAGFCLPLGELTWKHWKNSVSIFALSVFGITALYYHSVANLYVDIILAAWVGGIIGFILLRRRLKGAFGKRELGFLFLMLAFTVFIKWGYGILAVVIIFTAWFLIEYAMRKELQDKVNRLLRFPKFWIAVCLLIIAGGVVIWLLSLLLGEGLNKLLPGAGSLITSVLDIVLERTEKAVLTTNACVMGLFDQNVTRGTFKYGSLAALLMLGGLGFVSLRGIESKDYVKLMKRLHITWLLGSVVWFCLILVTYVSNFAYAEATIALSFNRYMGIYLMFGYFVMLISIFMPEEYLALRSVTEQGPVFVSHSRPNAFSMRMVLRVLISLVLILNISTALVTESTGLNIEEITGYAMVANVHEQSKDINKLTEDEDNILFIAQGGAERGLHRARFDVGVNVSGYKPNSYKFATSGDPGYDLSIIRAPKELPQLLIDGEYDYIWVYKTNSTLNKFTKSYFGMKLKSASLYRVIEQDGVLELEFVSALGEE